MEIVNETRGGTGTRIGCTTMRKLDDAAFKNQIILHTKQRE